MQLYIALVKQLGNDLQRLESCIASHQHWFWETDLLNPDKSAFCFFGTWLKLSRTQTPPTVTVAGCPITVSDKLKTLGVPLDAALAFEEYVNNAAKTCNFHMWGLRHIRPSISRGVANTMTACIVDTRLDYCNALLHDATEKSLIELQIVQNKLARVVCNLTTHQQHIIDLLRSLHWLPIRSRITFKVATLYYNAYRFNQRGCHIGAIRATAWTKICWDWLADSTKVTYLRKQSGTDFHCPSVTLAKSHLKLHLFRSDFLVE